MRFKKEREGGRERERERDFLVAMNFSRGRDPPPNSTAVRYFLRLLLFLRYDEIIFFIFLANVVGFGVTINKKINLINVGFLGQCRNHFPFFLKFWH